MTLIQTVATSRAQREERLRICSNCEFKTTYLGITACGKCNCPLGGKTILLFAKCPDNRWPTLSSAP